MGEAPSAPFLLAMVGGMVAGLGWGVYNYTTTLAAAAYLSNMPPVVCNHHGHGSPTPFYFAQQFFSLYIDLGVYSPYTACRLNPHTL